MGLLDFWRGKSVPHKQARRFDAAAVNRLTASWFSTSQSIDQELRSDLDRLRQRSRDLANNNDYVKKFLQMVVVNLIGPSGFVLQARVENAPGQPDRLANDAIELALSRWARKGICEVSGRLSFIDVQRAVSRAVARDGEAVIRMVRGVNAGNAFGFALQLLDVARLDTTLNREATGGVNAIVMGIEINAMQRPVAYHLREYADGRGKHERVLAGDILHLFVTDNPEQTRGMPWAHASMMALHDLGEFNKSALLAARKGADTLGFFISPDGTPPNIDSTTDGEQITVTVPGQYDVLPEGYDFKPYDSQYPNNVYDSFQKAILRRIASGLGVAFNSLANDLSEVNFSSIRSGVIEERDNWVTLQNWMIESFMIPVFEQWLDMSLLNGAIVMANGSALPAAKREKFMAHTWQGRRWSWVDPLKDIEASRLAVQSGIASPQMIAAQMGVDVDDVLTAIGQFEALVAEKNVKSVSYVDKAPPAPAPDPQPDPNLAKMAEIMVARSLEQKEQPKAPDIHVHMGETRVENNLPAPVTNVAVAAPDVSVRVDAPTVNVAAADVRVEAIMPEQEAPVVNVHVEAVMPDEMKMEITGMPTRETTTAIERDEKNNITKSTQTEVDK